MGDPSVTMQIERIALYGTNGEIREIVFRIGAVNIITGKSRTGKSAIIDIVDYCMGRSTYNIFEGVNRQSVAWYAVVFQIGDAQTMIAKPAPVGAAKSQSRAYMNTARKIELPALAELQVNSNDQAITAYLSGVLGIAENKTETREWQSGQGFEATVDHTKYYLFQEQGLVANRKLLFHRQDEQFIPQHIRDTLPYFLGAVDEDRLELLQKLREAKRDLALIRRRLKESESLVRNRETLANALLAEAQEVGILPNAVGEGALAQLRSAAQWVPGETLAEGSDDIEGLQRALRTAEGEVARQVARIREVAAYLRDTRGYTREASVQEQRLRSANIIPTNGDSSSCPLCSSTLEVPPPAMAAVRESLVSLQNELQGVLREEPRISEYLEGLREELTQLRQVARDRREEINALLAERETARTMRDRNARAARVAGRISMYVENLEVVDEDAPLRAREAEAASRLESLNSMLAPEEVEERMDSILRVLSTAMTMSAEELKLEFAGNPYRFDPGRLTVVADTPDRPIPMERQGSGENWLGCHLALMLALHQHFVAKHRPVPGFLILDQPSQVYFPTYDAYRALEGDNMDIREVGADVVAVQRMFTFLFNAVDALAPNLQIIVMEHANLSDPRFQEALVEKPWRNGLALIPEPWL